MTPIPPSRKNNGTRQSFKLGEIAELIGGTLIGSPDILISGVAGIKEAKHGDITFLANSKYLPFLKKTQASAVLTTPWMQKNIRLEGLETSDHSCPK